MQKKSTSSSAFLNYRALLGLLLCAATAYFLVIPIRSGPLRPESRLGLDRRRTLDQPPNTQVIGDQ
jgi:hypothetical protein